MPRLNNKTDKNYFYIKLIFKKIGIGINKITSLKRILSGQVNLVYLVNNKYIIRFSDGQQDGRNFKKEAKVLDVIGNRVLSPEVVLVDCSHKYIPFDTIVLKRIRGKTLAQEWLDCSSLQRKNYIIQLCRQLKTIHKLPLEEFSFLSRGLSWGVEFETYIKDCFEKAEADEEIDEKAVIFMKKYFAEHHGVLHRPCTYGLVHGDVHFENILVNNKKIVALLDFEYSNIAPLDFELSKIINFCLYPKKFVESKLEDQYNNVDLKKVIKWMKKYYAELFATNSLLEKLKVYMIPDVLWGFKWEHTHKISNKKEVMMSLNFKNKPEKEQDIAIKIYKNIYIDGTLDKLLH